MTAERKESNLANITIGSIMIILNCIWLFDYLKCIWPVIFHFDVLANWLSILNVIGGLTGIFLAVRIIKRKTNAWIALPVNFGVFCICLLIKSVI